MSALDDLLKSIEKYALSVEEKQTPFEKYDILFAHDKDGNAFLITNNLGGINFADLLNLEAILDVKEIIITGTGYWGAEVIENYITRVKIRRSNLETLSGTFLYRKLLEVLSKIELGQTPYDHILLKNTSGSLLTYKGKSVSVPGFYVSSIVSSVANLSTPEKVWNNFKSMTEIQERCDYQELSPK